MNKTHNETLRQLLDRAETWNVKFNRDKVQLNQRKVKYFRNIVSADGLRPDPRKIKPIVNIPNPQDSKGVQRLMDTLNFLREFVSTVAEIIQPMRSLMYAESTDSLPTQDAAMSQIKHF